MRTGGRVCGKPYQPKPEHGLQFPFYKHSRDSHKKIVKVVLSIRQGQSYERKYLDHEQQPQGKDQIILVGVCMGLQFPALASMFAGKPQGENYEFFWKAVGLVPREMFFVNFEDSGGFCLEEFGSSHKDVYTILKVCKQKNYAISFSGLGLMTFLNSWEVDIFGPNPFKSMYYSEQNRPLEVKVDKNLLKAMNSPFHGALAEIMTGDTLLFHATEQCLIFCRDPSKEPKDYTIKVLSVNVSDPSPNQQQNCEFAGSKGSYGHIALDYPCGFRMYLNTGYLSTLVKIPVSKGSLNSAAKQYLNSTARQKFFQETQKINPDDSQRLCQQANKLLNMLPPV